jgi:hypothetical protein
MNLPFPGDWVSIADSTGEAELISYSVAAIRVVDPSGKAAPSDELSIVATIRRWDSSKMETSDDEQIDARMIGFIGQGKTAGERAVAIDEVPRP